MFSTKIPRKYASRVQDIYPTDNDETPYMVILKKPWVYEEYTMMGISSREELLDVISNAEKWDKAEYEQFFGE